MLTLIRSFLRMAATLVRFRRSRVHPHVQLARIVVRAKVVESNWSLQEYKGPNLSKLFGFD